MRLIGVGVQILLHISLFIGFTFILAAVFAVLYVGTPLLNGTTLIIFSAGLVFLLGSIYLSYKRNCYMDGIGLYEGYFSPEAIVPGDMSFGGMSYRLQCGVDCPKPLVVVLEYVEQMGRRFKRIFNKRDYYNSEVVDTFQNKLPDDTCLSVNSDKIAAGCVSMKAIVSGKKLGSTVVFERLINEDGETLSFTKTTVSPTGEVLHVKDKLPSKVYIEDGILLTRGEMAERLISFNGDIKNQEYALLNHSDEFNGTPVVLTALSVKGAIEKVLNDLATIGDLVLWAEAMETLDDIRFEDDVVRDAIYHIANYEANDFHGTAVELRGILETLAVAT